MDELAEDEQIEENELNERQLNLKQLIETSKKLPVGKIKGIIRKFRNQFCGTIINNTDFNINKVNNLTKEIFEKSMADKFQIFIPIDPKIPNFFVKLHQPEIYYNKRIVVKFDKWDIDKIYPYGHFLKNLGEVNDVKVENEVILLENSVDVNPFSPKIINSLPAENAQLKVTDEDLKKRKDLRSYNICSIDPPGCKDIDDALHCRVLQNGDYEIGVHIADVTHYVKANSEVDKIAARNSNTVYMVHKRTDMLPKVLTENLCSLVGNKERFAFSVTWIVDKDTLEIKHVDYFKSIIKSKSAMTYKDALDRIYDLKDNTELTISIRNLLKISKHLRNKRLGEGALVLASTEMKFNVDFETNSINDISMYQSYETNQLVEEFMLLANVYVAQKIYNSYPACAVLRRHPLPKEKELGNLVNLLKSHGHNLNSTTSKLLGDSLDKIKKDNDYFFNKLIRIMLTRTMNQAKYFPSSEFAYDEFLHYGLAMPIYTHFTSPIRRYADVLVHRLLAASLDIDYLPSDMSNKVKSIKQCDQMNKQNRVAFFCSRASNEFSTYLFFQNKQEELEISIFSVDSFGIRGLSQKYGIEAEIFFLDGKNENMIRKIDYENKSLLLNDKTELKIFDKVLVSINPNYVNYRREIKYKFIKKI
jgi:exosome complex exonuclease DIS3/RRP44